MSQIFRIDSNTQKLTWEKLPNGTYRAYMTLGVAELPLEYVDAKGNKHTEIIKDDDLFNEDSLKSAYGLPICLNHPKFGNYNQNSEGKLVGHTLESFLRQDSTLLMPVVVDDYRGIHLIDDMIKNGEYAEVSPGYWVESLERSDSNESVYFQKNRTYDHLALLNSGEGRGGQNIVLRTDSKTVIDMAISTNPKIKVDAATPVTPVIVMQSPDEEATETVDNPAEEALEPVIVSTSDYTSLNTCVDTQVTEEGTFTYTTNNINNSMTTITFQGKKFDVTEEAAEAFNQTETRYDSLKSELVTANKQLDNANGQLEATKIQLDSKKELLTLDAASAFVKESIELWQKVEPIFKADSKDYEADYSLKPVQIKEVYIRKFHPGINLDGKSEDFVNGIWSGVSQNLDSKLHSDAVDKVKNQLSLLNSTEVKNEAELKLDAADNNNGTNEADKARKDQFERILNANK